MLNEVKSSRPRRRPEARDWGRSQSQQLEAEAETKVWNFVFSDGITETPQQRRAVVNAISVRQLIRCGINRSSVVARNYASSVSVEQQGDCSTVTAPWQRSSTGRSWFRLWELAISPSRRTALSYSARRYGSAICCSDMSRDAFLSEALCEADKALVKFAAAPRECACLQDDGGSRRWIANVCFILLSYVYEY